VQGLGITRIYGRNNIPVVLLDDTKINLTRHSKYCKELILYKPGGLLEILLLLRKDGKYKNWLLMPTNDRHVEILSKNKSELSKYFKVSTEEMDVLKFFFNKRLTYKLAEDLKIPIPKTWIPDSWADIELMDIKYPCIIKPAVMHTFYSKTKKKVFVCNNKKELKDNYLKAIDIIPKAEIIIQDIIPGNSEHQYSVCFMFNGKKPFVTLTVRRARQHPPDFGNATTYAETVNIPEIVEYAEKILKKVDYKGVCEVEFKYDSRDEKFKFLEVNPRTWKWHSIAEKSNSPILMSLYNYIYEYGEIIKNNQESAAFRHLVTDLPTILKMKIQGQKVSKSNRNSIKYAVWSKDDFKPVIYELLYLPFLILKR
jgi:predicted ATP-grasp superfamily ATP-dependent carboligase